MKGNLRQELAAQGGIARLDGHVLLRISGNDRLRYLNGQISNDLRKLQPGNALYACVLTAKGKLCADIRIFAGGESYLVEAAPALRESLPLRLERYVVADDVQIEEVSGEFTLFHLVLPALLPADTEALIPQGAIRGECLRYGYTGWDVLVPKAQADAFEQTFSGRHIPLTPEDTETIRIEKGIPRWETELSEEVLPAEAGLDSLAVDFYKGCYIGQEVVSRIRSVGHVNRALAGFRLRDGNGASPAEAFAPGAELFLPENPEKPIGTLTSTAYSFALSGHIALGYLKYGVTAAILIARRSGAPECEVEVCQLPFLP